MSSKSPPPLRRWRPAAALLLLTSLAAFFRFWQLDSIPPGFHFDEAYEALEAWRVMTQPAYRPVFFLGNFGVDPMFIYLTSLAFRLFSPAPEVMRGVAALIGVGTVLALYGLVAELARHEPRIPRSTPLLAAAALAFMRWHVLFSRVGIEPVLVPLFLVLILWAFWYALRANTPVAWILLGLATGLGPYTYPAGRLLPVLTLMLGILALLNTWPAARRASRRRLLVGLLAAGSVAVLVALPLIWHFAQHPEHLLLRSSQIAVGVEGSGPGSLGENLLRTLAMFSVRGDLDPRSNVPGMAALDLFISLPFYLGLAVTVWHILPHPVAGRPGKWDKQSSLVFASLLLAGAVMLAPTVFSDYAPHFRRAVGATPVVAFLIGLGLARIAQRPLRAISASAVSRPALGAQASDAAAMGSVARSESLTSRDLAGDLPPYVTAMAGSGHAGSVALETGPGGLAAGRVAPVSSAFVTYLLPLVAFTLLAGSAFLTATSYFVRWGQSPDLYYAYDEGLWEIGQYVLGIPREQAVFVTPRPAGDMTLAFAWREGRTVRHFDGRHAFVLPGRTSGLRGDPVYIVIEHEDYRGTNLLHDLYPDAVQLREFLDRSGRVYARAFSVPAGAAPARSPQHTAENGSNLAAWPDVELVGYDLDTDTHRPGETFYIQLWWRVPEDVRPQRDWTVFMHLVGPQRSDGSVLWAGDDSRPGRGSVPMTNWRPGDMVLDEYRLQVPADALPGDYVLEVGLYDLTAGGARATTARPSGSDHVNLGTVRVE